MTENVATTPTVPFASLLPPPKPLDSSKVNLATAWKSWISEFSLFATATNFNSQPSEAQAATFVVFIGDEGRKIFDTLKFDSEKEKQNTEAIKKFEERCKPAVNLAYQDYLFGTRDQKQDERFDDWLTGIRLLAKQCDFGSMEERMLRTRIILGAKEKDLQRQFIRDNLSYEQVVAACRTHEKSKEQYEKCKQQTPQLQRQKCVGCE